MDWETTATGSKVETWTDNRPHNSHVAPNAEVDLGRHRSERHHPSQQSNPGEDCRTSDFSSLYLGSEYDSRDILRDSTNTNPSHVPTPSPGPRSTSRSQRHGSNSSAATPDPTGLRFDYGSIPPHCRMDSLGPMLDRKRQLASPPSVSGWDQERSRDDMYDRAASKHSTQRSLLAQDISHSTGYCIKPGYEANEPGIGNAPSHSQSGSREGPIASTDQLQPKQTRKGRVNRGGPVRKPHRQVTADTDEEKLKRVEANLSKFTKKIDTKVLARLLRDSQCITSMQYDHVCRLSEILPRQRANQELWKILKRAPSWWQSLEDALEKMELNELLKIMQD